MGDTFQFRDRATDGVVEVQLDDAAAGLAVGIATSEGQLGFTLTHPDAGGLGRALVRNASPQVPAGGEGLSPAEFSQLVGLLHRYAQTELDQFEHWSLSTSYGEVYIHIHRSAAGAEMYNNLDAWLPESPAE